MLAGRARSSRPTRPRTRQRASDPRRPGLARGAARLVPAALGALLLGLACGDLAVLPRASLPVPEPRRGMWVLCEGSQRVLEHPERLEWLLEDARQLGVTDLFVQVFRGGRAWFPSSHADSSPYDRVWRTEEGDAIEQLIERAHAEGLRVHAWVNALSLAGNRDAEILVRLGRDAAAVDQHGRSVLDYPKLDVPPPQAGFYRMGTPAVWVDPAAPGVADYLADTFAELLTRYPGFDGLHLDYIRYPDVLPFSPGLRFGVGLSFGHGKATRERFRAETGKRAPFGDSLFNANRYDDWRRDKLTELVAGVAARAREARPGVRLSAAVWAWPTRAYLSIFQDWRGWLRAGHLDFAVPMLYTRDDLLLDYGAEDFAGFDAADRIWVGLGVWLFAEQPERATAQLRQVAGRPPLGSALFSWDSLRDAPALREALARSIADAPRGAGTPPDVGERGP